MPEPSPTEKFLAAAMAVTDEAPPPRQDAEGHAFEYVDAGISRPATGMEMAVEMQDNKTAVLTVATGWPVSEGHGVVKATDVLARINGVPLTDLLREVGLELPVDFPLVKRYVRARPRPVTSSSLASLYDFFAAAPPPRVGRAAASSSSGGVGDSVNRVCSAPAEVLVTDDATSSPKRVCVAAGASASASASAAGFGLNPKRARVAPAASPIFFACSDIAPTGSAMLVGNRSARVTWIALTEPVYELLVPATYNGTVRGRSAVAPLPEDALLLPHGVGGRPDRLHRVHLDVGRREGGGRVGGGEGDGG